MTNIEREDETYTIRAIRSGTSVMFFVFTFVLLIPGSILIPAMVKAEIWECLMLPVVMILFGGLFLIGAISELRSRSYILDEEGFWFRTGKVLKLICTWEEISWIEYSRKRLIRYPFRFCPQIEIKTNRKRTSKEAVYYGTNHPTLIPGWSRRDRIWIVVADEKLTANDHRILQNELKIYWNRYGSGSGVLDTRPAASQVKKVESYQLPSGSTKQN
jgi:hypothetical protein